MSEKTREKSVGAKRRNGGPPVRGAAKLAPDVALLLPRETRAGRKGAESAVEVARIFDDASASGSIELVPTSGARIELAREQWEEIRGDLKGLVREELAPLGGETREGILKTLASSTALEVDTSFELSASLYGIREVLRERLPQGEVREDRPVGLSVEQILAIDETSFWITGWAHDEDGCGEVTLVSPESARVPITAGAFRHDRPDVVDFYSGLGQERTSDHGFTAYFQLPAPSYLSSGWIAELRTSDGLALEVECPAVSRDPATVRAAILGEIGARGQVGGTLALDHGRHALTGLQERIVAESKLDSVESFGEIPRNPSVSIVVPLYKRLDFLEHQMLQFSLDPEFAEVDLIYVLDSPEQSEELSRQARELFALYGLPFRIVHLSAGAGYAGANEHGIGVARTQRLLLLNSDVIPDRPGWLGRMGGFYEETEGIGALGAKLLYEDDSLQHAGLYFHRQAGTELWENAHCFKGLNRRFAPANVARSVPAVTAACMLIDRDLYEEVGGLPLHYVQGDYEDSELCLNLAAAGRQNWYLPEVELYHLEGQSYVPGVRRIPSEYNRWLHSTLHGEQIESLMADFDPNATVAAGDGERRGLAWAS